MIVADLPGPELRRALGNDGVRVRLGPVVARIRSRIERVASGVALHYAAHPLEPDDAFVDFDVRVDPPRGLRAWLRPQAVFQFDGSPPFLPLPIDQAFPMLEWGLNWCVSANCHQYLAIHSAVVERDGGAVLLPAPPGSGKSTLCAGLVARGWRLLSDELALIEPATGMLVPLPRPISLKNASIDVIGRFASDAVFSPVVRDTVKGAVAHMRPPERSVRRAHEYARPRWVVFPRFEAGAPATLSPLSRARTFMRLADNAFNYSYHGRQGFEVLANMVDGCACYEFTYGLLDEAITAFDRMTSR